MFGHLKRCVTRQKRLWGRLWVNWSNLSWDWSSHQWKLVQTKLQRCLFCLFQGRFRLTSCVEYGQQGFYKDGIYKIYDNDGNSFPSYCDLKSEPGIAWTLVMSWSKKNRFISAFCSTPFQSNAPENENSPNWDRYRLSLERMRSLQVHSTHWRATCSYPTHGIDFTDYLRGNFKDFNIVDFPSNGECKKVEYVDIRGLNGTNLTAPFWANVGVGLHTDSSIDFCELNATVGAVWSEDNFGSYNSINPKFRCTQEDSSTTQWWFGAQFKK